MNTTFLAADRLLLCGAVAGLIFFTISTVEMFRRPAFDISRHAISMLSLGEGGWIMKAVFITSGILTVAAAVGIALKLASGWSGLAGALLVGCYAIGLVIAGIFDAPAGLGFPPGTPTDQQPVMTTGAILHSVGFMVAFGGLILSSFILAYHFFTAGQPLYAVMSIAAGIAMPALVALGVSMTIAPGVAFYWAAMVGWAWLGITVLKLWATE